MSCSANENNLATGWARLYRSIFDDETYPLQEHRTFTKFEAKLDLLLLVRGTKQERLFDGKLLTIERGSQIFSYSFLAQRWRWSIKKVRTFLGNLRTRGYLELKSGKTGTLITIANYNSYNSLGDSGAHNGTVKGTPRARKGQEYKKVSKERRESPVPASPGKSLLEFFKTEYNTARGKPYHVDHPPKQQGVFTGLLKNYSADQLKSAIRAFLRDERQWLVENGHTVWLLSKEINRYIKSHAGEEGIPVPEYVPSF